MPPWPEVQSAFASALRQADAPPPDVIGKTCGAPSTKRFGVYKNNVALSLIEALAANYPVVAALIGEEAFSALAQNYISSNLPKTPLLMEYGGQFPEFISSFEPLSDLPYLTDMAELEMAWNSAYNAADLDLLSIDTLGTVPPDDLGDTCFKLHPAVSVVRSAFPIASIWFAHQASDTTTALKNLPEGGEDVLVSRPDADVELRSLPAGSAVFIKQLATGAPLAAAAQAAAEAHDEFDISTGIGGLFEAGTLIGLLQPGT